MKKKRMFLLGSSLFGIAMCAAVAAEAQEEAPSNAAAIAASDAAAAAPEDTSIKQRGFYAGGSVGGSFFDGAGKNSKIFSRSTDDSNGDGRSDAFTPDSIDDESNFLWSVFVGYRLSDWLGAEVGWTDIGGFSATDRQDLSDPNDTPHNDNVKVNVDGLEARLRAFVPLGTERVSGIGGVGIFVFSSNSPKKCKGEDQGACTKGSGHYDREPAALDPRRDSGQAFTLSAGLQFKVTENVLLRTEYQHFFAVLDQGVDMVTASVVVGFYDFFGQGSGGNGGGDMGGIVVE